MRIAGIQLKASKDVKENLKNALKFLKIAVKEEADIICFPELAVYPWFPAEVKKENFSLAHYPSDDIFSEIKAVARESSSVIILPFFEKSEVKGVYYNSSMVINSDGNLCGIYRKVHLPLIPGWEERFYFKEGDLGFPVFHTEKCKIGVMLGWDVFFPEVYRILTLNGADIIFAPTASALSSQPRWLKIIGANALMNTIFIVRVNRVGKEGDLEFYGGSFCFSPDGGLVSEPAGEGEGVVLWNIDLDLLFEIRRLFTFLKDRRPSLYLDIAGIVLEKGEKNEL